MTYRPFSSAPTRADRHEASTARPNVVTRSGKCSMLPALRESLSEPAKTGADDLSVPGVVVPGAVKAHSPVEVEDRIGQGDGSDTEVCFPCSTGLLASYVRAAHRYGFAISMSSRFLDETVPGDGPLYQRALAIFRAAPGTPWLDCLAQVGAEATAWAVAGEMIAQAKSHTLR